MSETAITEAKRIIDQRGVAMEHHLDAFEVRLVDSNRRLIMAEHVIVPVQRIGSLADIPAASGAIMTAWMEASERVARRYLESQGWSDMDAGRRR